ncbi:hypothetical protein E2C01_052128 [Portunus trituberculatus]|uniref:Uncharacterized protein n=1 Tax=Portunus trituberculatus TaxID=210409 RepID=A0A5B7GKU7_PORTR|nr:hypothetical protein [Portunus trituberculatus]
MKVVTQTPVFVIDAKRGKRANQGQKKRKDKKGPLECWLSNKEEKRQPKLRSKCLDTSLLREDKS